MLLADDAYHAERAGRYRQVAQRKRFDALGGESSRNYYECLVTSSFSRMDDAALKDRKQIEKDLPRTFAALPPLKNPEDEEYLKPLLKRVLAAYIERGRAVGAASRANGVAAFSMAVTTARGILTGYPQGLNFLAGMGLLALSSGSLPTQRAKLEEDTFWLLSHLLEDVLDPDFFGADVRGNLKMVHIGGLGMRSFILEKAKVYCPKIFKALGEEACSSCLGSLLDSWVLALFVGCAPHRLLEHLWDHLLLPSPYHPTERVRSLPTGLAVVIGFGLSALKCCGEDAYKDSEMVKRLAMLHSKHVAPEELALEACELVASMRKNLHQWPEDQDDLFLCNFTRILVELAENTDQFAGLWEDVRCRKQAIADCAGNCDEQLMTLAQQTHFSLEEIELLRKQFRKMRNSSQETTVLDLKGFKEVVKEAVPEFPPELCGRLFQKLDCFGVGRLTFMELACGMSALALGTMDEKLQVCFDLFDSEGRRALTLKDLNDLCTTLFKVALSHGSVNRKASTDEVMAMQSGALSQRSSETDLPFPMTPPMRPSSVIVVGREKVRASAPAEITKSITMDDQELPSRSMLLRLLAAAKVHTPGGQRLVAYEDFCSVARMEPALLCLFSWCLPRPPERMPVFMFESTTLGLRQPGLCARVRRTCDRIRCWFRRRS